MEGPSLYLAQKQLRPFKGETVLRVSGNTTIEKDRFKGQVVKDIFSHGKHLVFQFDGFALRVHFLLYGTFEAVVNGVAVTGDYKRARTPRLMFEFANGTLSMFNCSVIIFEEKNMKKTYDFKIDVLSTKWDPDGALRAMNKSSDQEIADVLLDQAIFGGVGNIIKNEILSQAYTNPKTKVSCLTAKQKKELIARAVAYSKQFYRWRKAFVLRKHLLIYRRATCPHCERKVVREKTGKRVRWSYYCLHCQRFVS